MQRKFRNRNTTSTLYEMDLESISENVWHVTPSQITLNLGSQNRSSSKHTSLSKFFLALLKAQPAMNINISSMSIPSVIRGKKF